MAWLFAMFLGRSLFGRRSAFRDPGPHLFRDPGQALLGLVRRGYLCFSFVEFCLGLRTAFRDPGLYLGLAFDLWRLGSTLSSADTWSMETWSMCRLRHYPGIM